jgi:molybdenum transport protein
MSVPEAAWAAGLWDEPLRALLSEDAPHGDLTTGALSLGATPAKIEFEARGPMTVAGIEAAARLLTLCGVRTQLKVRSGDTVPPATALLRGEGPADAVLLGWKVAQNLVEHSSGMAGAVAAMVRLLRQAGHAVPVACTRKCAPGTRWWAAQAIVAGGGVMHRLGLSETLLVFPEHRALLGDTAWLAQLAALRGRLPERRRVVEVGDADSALAAAAAGAEVLQLERFAPGELRALRERLRTAGHTVRLAPAGGVTLANALAYAEAGADLLVSSAPYLAAPADVQVRIGPTA